MTKTKINLDNDLLYHIQYTSTAYTCITYL